MYQVGFCTYQIHCDGKDTEEETCGELKEIKLSFFYMWFLIYFMCFS